MAKSINKPIYLVITPFFPSSSHWQGAFVLDQVKAIARTGKYKVLVFRPCALWQKKQPYKYDGIEVNYVSSFFMPTYFFNGFGGWLNGWSLLFELKKRKIGLTDIKVVHVHTAAFACYAAALKKACSHIKTIIQYHDPDPYQIRLGKWAKWKPNALFRAKKLIAQFDKIDLHLCISKKVEYNLIQFPHPHPQEYFESYKKILDVVRSVPTPICSNVYVLYNGVDTKVFHKKKDDISLTRKDTFFSIGCVGNFIDWKDQITLIKAVEILVKKENQKNIRVSFVGSGVTMQKCKDYILEHRIDEYFSFEQEVHHDQLPNYYQSLDLFVLPSYFEGFGCVFTEAAACGVPFMGCKNQGYSEYIPEEDQDKWLIEPGDYKQLAKIIADYIHHRYEQNYCHTFVIDDLIKDFLEFIEKL